MSTYTLGSGHGMGPMLYTLLYTCSILGSNTLSKFSVFFMFVFDSPSPSAPEKVEVWVVGE
ncbi:hypothetical protein K445DRAFT_313256 [Daldinia sp. EC12]|nr:hypothetical protein K445DRAFT_313256 [Daldinia sp. EC12]